MEQHNNNVVDHNEINVAAYSSANGRGLFIDTDGKGSVTSIQHQSASFGNIPEKMNSPNNCIDLQIQNQPPTFDNPENYQEQSTHI